MEGLYNLVTNEQNKMIDIMMEQSREIKRELSSLIRTAQQKEDEEHARQRAERRRLRAEAA